MKTKVPNQVSRFLFQKLKLCLNGRDQTVVVCICVCMLMHVLVDIDVVFLQEVCGQQPFLVLTDGTCDRGCNVFIPVRKCANVINSCVYFCVCECDFLWACIDICEPERLKVLWKRARSILTHTSPLDKLDPRVFPDYLRSVLGQTSSVLTYLFQSTPNAWWPLYVTNTTRVDPPLMKSIRHRHSGYDSLAQFISQLR